LRLTVLVDNNTLIDRYFCGEPGVSYLIEDEDKKVLFDVGYTDLFIQNANKMGLDLLDADFVVLSHGHLDHTWGLLPLTRLFTEAKIEGIDHVRPTLVAHPETFLTKSIDGLDIGSMLSENALSFHFDLRLSREPVQLTENLLFLGEIKRTNDFENQEPLGKITKNGSEEDDFLMDDSTLVYRSKEGLVIITGCSHAGICNIVEYAKKIFQEDRIADIVGGFHLLNPSDSQLRGTQEYMKELNPAKVHACHCTDLKSKIALSQVVTLEEVGVGLQIEYS